MAAGDPGESPEQADDLFGRWLAHRTQQDADSDAAAAADSAPGDDAARDLTRDADRAPAAGSDMTRQNAGFEPVIMPSVRRRLDQDKEPRVGVLRRGLLRRAGTADDPGDEPDTTPPVSPPAAAAPAAPVAAPAPPPRPARATSGEEPAWIRDLRDAAAPAARRVDRPVDADQPPAAPAPAAAPEPTPQPTPEPTPEPEPAAAASPETPVVTRSTAELSTVRIAQATTTAPPAEAAVEPEPEPEPEPEAAPAETFSDWVSRMRGSAAPPRPVRVAAEVAAAAQTPEPAAAEPVADPEPAAPDWRQRFRESFSRDSRTPEPEPEPAAVAPEPAPEPEPEPVAAAPEPDPVAAEPDPEPEPEPEPVAAEPVAAEPEPEPRPDPVAAEREQTPPPAPAPRTDRVPIASIPDPYVFKPRRATRVLVTVVFLAGVAASAWLARAAYLDPDQAGIALAATAAFATAVLWAIRATTTITRLTVKQGQLEVVRDGTRTVLDLTSDFTPIEVKGTPGHRGWRVRFVRRGSAPFDIDSSIVDPVEFTRVLRFYRPAEPAPEPAPEPAEAEATQ